MSLSSVGGMSFSDASWLAFQTRVTTNLDAAADYVVKWANSGKAPNTYEDSMWVVGAALSRASNNATVKTAAMKLTGSLLVETLRPTQYFTGGNMGWPAWAFASVYSQFQPMFDADPVLYSLKLPLDPLIPADITGPMNISMLFRTAFKYGSYAPIDSTSNHDAMNSAARFLVEYSLPGQSNFRFSRGHGNFGELTMQRIATNLLSGGFGEYGT